MAYVKCLINVVSSTIPDGKTVTPTDDVSILLVCAGRTETYTTISALLADATALAGVISSNNAIDYLVRSTTFANDVCTDQGAMADIGASNYASNTLLADSTWCSAICNSTYFESVLNVKVPTMTSNTTPSGVASASDEPTLYNAKRYAYMAYDGNSASLWLTNLNNGAYIQYQFTSSTICKLVKFTNAVGTSGGVNYNLIKDFKIFGVNNGVETELLSETCTNTGVAKNESFIINNNTEYEAYKLALISSSYPSGLTQTTGFAFLQFYGRADV